MSENEPRAATPTELTFPPDEERVALPRPVLTYGLIAVLAMIYIGEATVQIGSPGGFLDPSIQTLVAWGGMSRNLVMERGEWFRVLTAAFLHGGLAHLAMNCLALYIAGIELERFIGRLWFAALYCLGALGGGIASILINPANIVGVGASGAITALFGFLCAIAFRFEKGPIRRALIANSVGTLLFATVPALIPSVTGGSGMTIDYAAHAGGAAVGGLIGLLFVLIWPRDRRYPPLAPLALAVCLASATVLGWGAYELRKEFAEQSFSASLMPDEVQPKTDEAARSRASELIEKYPNDPRGYFYKALDLADKNDTKGMEAQARIAVELAERYPGVFRDRFRDRVRMVHALALAELKRVDEAKKVASPICAKGDTEITGVLKKAGLCG